MYGSARTTPAARARARTSGRWRSLMAGIRSRRAAGRRRAARAARPCRWWVEEPDARIRQPLIGEPEESVGSERDVGEIGLAAVDRARRPRPRRVEVDQAVLQAGVLEDGVALRRREQDEVGHVSAELGLVDEERAVRLQRVRVDALDAAVADGIDVAHAGDDELTAVGLAHDGARVAERVRAVERDLAADRVGRDVDHDQAARAGRGEPAPRSRRSTVTKSRPSTTAI